MYENGHADKVDLLQVRQALHFACPACIAFCMCIQLHFPLMRHAICSGPMPSLLPSACSPVLVVATVLNHLHFNPGGPHACPAVQLLSTCLFCRTCPTLPEASPPLLPALRFACLAVSPPLPCLAACLQSKIQLQFVEDGPWLEYEHGVPMNDEARMGAVSINALPGAPAMAAAAAGAPAAAAAAPAAPREQPLGVQVKDLLQVRVRGGCRARAGRVNGARPSIGLLSFFCPRWPAGWPAGRMAGWLAMC